MNIPSAKEFIILILSMITEFFILVNDSEESTIVYIILFIAETLIIPVVFFIISLINFCKNKHQKYSVYNFCIQLILNTTIFGYYSIPILFSNFPLYVLCLILTIWVILYTIFLFVLLKYYKKINDKPPFYLFYIFNICITMILMITLIILLIIN